MDKKSFSIEIFKGKFQNFLNKFQSPQVFSLNPQRIDARFLKFFQNYSRFLLLNHQAYLIFLIKNSILNKKFSQNSSNFSKNSWFLHIFLLRFPYIRQLRGAPPPEPHTNAYDNIFLIYWHNFREKFRLNYFKNLKKWQKFHQNYPKIAGFQ